MRESGDLRGDVDFGGERGEGRGRREERDGGERKGDGGYDGFWEL